MEEAACRASFIKKGKRNAGFSTVGEFHWRVGSHIGLYPAWMSGVDFDFRVLQLVCEMDGERVQRRL